MQASRPRHHDGAEERDLPYDPAEWSQRLEEARVARAKVLAAREGLDLPPRNETPPHVLGVPVAAPRLPRSDPPAPGADGGGRRAGRWLGFSAGAVVAVLLGVLLLLGI